MNRDWLTWTARACRPIRFKHDRRAAERELRAHLEDEALALMESGLTREQAQKKALAAMLGLPWAFCVYGPFCGTAHTKTAVLRNRKSFTKRRLHSYYVCSSISYSYI